MKSKPKKNLNIKVVLLKQPAHNPPLYTSSQIKQELRSKVSFKDSKQHQKNTSIAYLSSIIQDDRLIDEDNYCSFDQSTRQEGDTRNKKYSASFEEQNQLFKLLKPREKGRELSCLVHNSQQRNKIYRSKTEGIDKIFEERKLMPIDRLKVGTKNIKFSSKNKQQLIRDFNEFVVNNQLSKGTLQQNTERDKILYQKRRMQHRPPRKSTLWLTSIQNEAKSQKSRSQQKEVAVKNISPKKARREEQPKYASYLRRLKSSIPQIDHFGWSKLNKSLFKLKSQ